jgi:hypothetical protein
MEIVSKCWWWGRSLRASAGRADIILQQEIEGLHNQFQRVCGTIRLPRDHLILILNKKTTQK